MMTRVMMMARPGGHDSRAGSEDSEAARRTCRRGAGEGAGPRDAGFAGVDAGPREGEKCAGVGAGSGYRGSSSQGGRLAEELLDATPRMQSPGGVGQVRQSPSCRSGLAGWQGWGRGSIGAG